MDIKGLENNILNHSKCTQQTNIQFKVSGIDLCKLEHLLRDAVLLHQVVGLGPRQPELCTTNMTLVDFTLLSGMNLSKMRPAIVKVGEDFATS